MRAGASIRMATLRSEAPRIGLKFIITALTFAALGCGLPGGTPAGAVVGRSNNYDYSPSVIQVGNVQQFWWCGNGANPYKPSQSSDVILYESINATANARPDPVIVLGETPNAWDAAFTCNPKVIRGSFDNPLGDNQTYTYAMYYVGTASFAGIDNSIGVAFSNDGITWRKYPQPVILSTSQTGFGVGQPAVYNSDGKQAIWVFYEDSTPVIHHTKAISTDGVHFVAQGNLTTNGLDPTNPQPSWGDMAYDLKTGYWYAAYNLPTRNPSTTGGVIERGQYGFQLYRIPDSSLLTGATPWQQLMTVDTNLTGNESNFLPGFLRDMYGNVNIGPYPSIQMYTSISNPRPAWNASPASAGSSGDTLDWDIGSAIWIPNSPMVPLFRYVNGTANEVTTGWVDPSGGFNLESTLGHLYQSPQQGATIPFYGCKSGSTNYFVTLDSTCQGGRLQGTNGYGYSNPVAGLKLVALYSCSTGQDHFLSQDSKCGGNNVQGILGYILP
jgi:hypothetical protein